MKRPWPKDGVITENFIAHNLPGEAVSAK
jgi:hypothetical protein